MQPDPFAPKYGVTQPNAPTMQYGGMPVAQPKKGINVLLIPLIIAVVLLLSVSGAAIWAYMGMVDYRDNVEPKIAQAVAIAKEKTSTQKDNEFLEREKQPLKTYTGPQVAGNLSFQYPKTWSGFVSEADSAELVNGYFHPDVVPGVDSKTDFALRVQVVSSGYDQEVKKFESKLKTGKVTVSPFKSPKMQEAATGVRVDGEINTGQQGSLVILELRDKTILISSESQQFAKDFNETILTTLTYNP